MSVVCRHTDHISISQMRGSNRSLSYKYLTFALLAWLTGDCCHFRALGRLPWGPSSSSCRSQVIITVVGEASCARRWQQQVILSPRRVSRIHGLKKIGGPSSDSNFADTPRYIGLVVDVVAAG
jgi:hypothetical protein